MMNRSYCIFSFSIIVLNSAISVKIVTQGDIVANKYLEAVLNQIIIEQECRDNSRNRIGPSYIHLESESVLREGIYR